MTAELNQLHRESLNNNSDHHKVDIYSRAAYRVYFYPRPINKEHNIWTYESWKSTTAWQVYFFPTWRQANILCLQCKKSAAKWFNMFRSMRRCSGRWDNDTAFGKLVPLRRWWSNEVAGIRMKTHDEKFGGYWEMASVLQGPGGVLQTPYLGCLRESLFDTACIIDVK